MKTLGTISTGEHITGLTVAGFYYLLMGNELGAETCWKTAVELIPEHEILQAWRAMWLSLPIQYGGVS